MLNIGGRLVGPEYPPLVIAEIGINHEGDYKKAVQMIDDAYSAGCECIKFQIHIPEEEMIPNNIIPGNASESIWDIISRCTLTEEEDIRLKKYVESKGMIYLATPFSRAAAIRLARMGVSAFKIGSGECNNYPLIKHIASYKKPIILSTGMNNLASIRPAVNILRDEMVDYALFHCTSMYPTPYDKVRLGALSELSEHFPDAVIGISDHSKGNYTCFAAVALGARIIEKHFTSDKSWPGPDIPISIDPSELKDLIIGSKAIFQALGGSKDILLEEKATIDFAYSCIVSIRDIHRGEILTPENIWVKRPGTGDFKAIDYWTVINKIAKKDIRANVQLKKEDIVWN
jgi:N-acetylneuraminate synthase